MRRARGGRGREERVVEGRDSEEGERGERKEKGGRRQDRK